MKHSFFSNYLFAINFFVLINSCLCIIVSCVVQSNKSNFVYVLVHGNILMYVILAYHLFM